MGSDDQRLVPDRSVVQDDDRRLGGLNIQREVEDDDQRLAEPYVQRESKLKELTASVEKVVYPQRQRIKELTTSVRKIQKNPKREKRKVVKALAEQQQ